uniref:Copper transport protein n=1 Tax=Bursaphelenchus xylophilus TaxID=6326 RepID=A0A1I7S4Z6_BURXY
MMWTYLHTTINDTILFKFWQVKSSTDMAASCAIVFVMAVLLEFLKFVRLSVERKSQDKLLVTKSYCSRLFNPFHLLQTGLFGIQIILSYLLMLVFMTFSVWLGLSIAVGAGVGYFVFGAQPATSSETEAVLVGHNIHN